MGKGKHPSIAFTAQGRKLWPLAAAEQRTACRHDSGPARDQLRYAQTSEKYAFVLSNYALPACCRAQYRGWNASVSDVSSVDTRCPAQLIHVSAHPPVPLQDFPTTVSCIFQLQADSVPFLVICSSCQHVAQETEMDCLNVCTAAAKSLLRHRQGRIPYRGKVLQISYGTAVIFLYTDTQNDWIWIRLCLGNRRYKEKATEIPFCKQQVIEELIFISERVIIKNQNLMDRNGSFPAIKRE